MARFLEWLLRIIRTSPARPGGKFTPRKQVALMSTTKNETSEETEIAASCYPDVSINEKLISRFPF